MANFDSDFMKGFALGKQLRPQVLAGLKEATMYSYNGVVLPKIPVVDGYPHMVMVYTEITGRANLYAFSDPVFAREAENNGVVSVWAWADEAGLYCKWHSTDGGDWVEDLIGGTANTTAAGITVGGNPAWANKNICYEDGTVYLAGTTPVPVYE